MMRGDNDVDDDICFAGWNLRSADHGLVLCHLLPHVAVLHRVCGHLLDLWSASLSLLFSFLMTVCVQPNTPLSTRYQSSCTLQFYNAANVTVKPQLSSSATE